MIDFAYKGDDDTFIIPDNLAFILKNMKSDVNAIGSLKFGDHPLRDVGSKYVMPEDLWPQDLYDQGFLKS